MLWRLNKSLVYNNLLRLSSFSLNRENLAQCSRSSQALITYLCYLQSPKTNCLFQLWFNRKCFVFGLSQLPPVIQYLYTLLLLFILYVQYLCSLLPNGQTGQYSLSNCHCDTSDTIIFQVGVTRGASKRQGVFNIQLSFPKLTRIFYD